MKVYKFEKRAMNDPNQIIELRITAPSREEALVIHDKIELNVLQEYSVDLKTTEVTRPAHVIKAFSLEDAKEKAVNSYEIDPDSSMAQIGQGEYKYTEIVNVALIE